MTFPKGGYSKKILRVDLTERKIYEEALSQDIIYQYIGGTGLASRLLYEETFPHLNPLSPENRIIFTTGPLTGTLVPGSGTYTVISRSCLTGLSTVAQANGFFGARMKYSGFDAVILQGRSETPVYLHIHNGTAEIVDAHDLKGKDAFKTDAILRRRYGEDGIESQISVAAIGPAGENCVRFSVIVSDKGHIVASGGIGAIMGAKNLKAVVVHGNQKISFDQSNTKAFLINVRQWRQEAFQTAMGKVVNEKGTLGLLLPYQEKGWVPIKNLTTNLLPEVSSFDADYLRRDFYQMVPRSCSGCTFHHCHSVQVKKGRYRGLVAEEPEYEIMAGFGPNLGISDPGAITMLNDLNDRLGMDGKEISFLISMLMEGYEKSFIGSDDLDGITLRWGDVRSVKKLMMKISQRDGVGNILADGVMRTAERLGGEFPKMAVFVKKGNAPHIHDPRTRWGTLFTQIISNTGSQEGVDITARGNPEIGLEKPTSEPDEYVGQAQALTGPKRQFEECLVFCYFQACSLKTMVETLNSVTGGSYTIEECLKVGKRVINLLRMFNQREGMKKEDDSCSLRLTQSPIDGPGKGKSLAPTLENIKQAYYKEMGWGENGMPTPRTLKELGLEFTLFS
jgi:aldehyde:ferredoxin oxidoreductase